MRHFTAEGHRRIRQACFALFSLVVVFLSACGGGGNEPQPSEIGAALSKAKTVKVDAALCARSDPEYMFVNGECLKAFLGMALPAPSSEKGPQAASKEPQALALLSDTALFDWAGPALPQYFGYYYIQGYDYVPGYGYFTYRYYTQTGNYLGVFNGVVFVYGPATYYTLLTVGNLQDYYCSVYSCYPRTFIPWTGSVNGVVVKDAQNESFAFYSDTRCLYSYAQNQETTNYCLGSSYSGYLANQPFIVMAAASNTGGCLAVLADPYGRQIDIWTDAFGIRNFTVLNTYWNTFGC